MTARFKSLTLAIHPWGHGFGWVAFSSPLSPHDWGTVHSRRGDKNAECLRRVDRLLDRLSPEILVLEAFEERHSSRRGRIARLCRAIVASAMSRGVDVAIHPYSRVRSAFAKVGARSRHDIATAIARQFPMFARFLPAPRREWEAVHPRMCLFSAIAVGLTHFQSDAEGFLERLSD